MDVHLDGVVAHLFAPLAQSLDQLVERLCEWGEEVSNNAIEVYIHRLRKKIEKGPIRIATVRGLGYCLEKIPG
jgi:two-component system OmpR family response regulator